MSKKMASRSGLTVATRSVSIKRGYSREFTPHGASGKRYLLDGIPAGLWADVRGRAKRDGVSLRALILSLLRDWLLDADCQRRTQ